MGQIKENYNYFSSYFLILKVALMVNQMHRAKGKGYLKWTPHVPNLPTAALNTPQKVWSNWELVKLKMLDFSDHTRTGISILT